jgi:transmembrane sensor
LSAGPIGEPVNIQAAAWFDRIQREHVSAEERRAFEQWLADSPDNLRAYQSVQHAWNLLQDSTRQPDILALRQEATLRVTRRASRRLQRFRWALAASILMVLTGTLATVPLRWLGHQSMLAWTLDSFHHGSNLTYTTAVGERLMIALDDGSELTLDTASEVHVRFSKHERYINLTRGQALFEVARDRERPFVVEARQRRLVALGTAFDVRMDEQEMTVTIVEGAVRVEKQTGPAAPTTLTAGDQFVADDKGADHVHPAEADKVTSWRKGQVVFDNTRLGDAVIELNRYSLTKIQVEPEIADLRLSGAFNSGRQQAFIEAVTTYFPIAVASHDEHSILLKRR